MLKSIEVQGKTEDEAIEIALEQLGLSRDDVSVEIVEMAKPGLFGRKSPAIVRVEYESDNALPQPEAVEVSSAASAEDVQVSSPAPRRKGGRKSDIPAMPIDAELYGRVETYLKGLFEKMDFDVTFELSDANGTLNVVLNASDPGILIGRRGETLDALQHLTNYSINHSSTSRARVHIDTENYRKRRGEALESLALRTASKVVKYRRNMTLDPMNAYERHIIHAALQDNDQVSTFSVGNDANRRVVVAYGQSENSSERSDSPQFKEWH